MLHLQVNAGHAGVQLCVWSRSCGSSSYRHLSVQWLRAVCSSAQLWSKSALKMRGFVKEFCKLSLLICDGAVYLHIIATFRFLGVFAPKRGSKMYIFGSLGERGKVLVSTFVWLSGFLWLLGLTVVGTVGKLAFSKLYNYQDIYSSYEIRSFSIQKIIIITYVLIQMQYEK